MNSVRETAIPVSERAAAYVALAKPDVTFLVVITTVAGFYIASRGPLDWALLAHTLVGTMLAAAGTATLNQYTEREADALMRRTAARPIPSGVISPTEAFWLGSILVVVGVVYLSILSNVLAAALTLATTVLYLGVYTPLKKITPLATFIGAFPGAIPPLIGWAAARGSLSLGAWILFAILFLWQFPHFLAIAWMYREDYARAGIKMLPVVEPSGDRTFRQILVTAAILVPISLLPSVIGITGIGYFFGATVLGMALLQVCFWAERSRTNIRAKWLMHATVIHIPILLALMILDRAIK
jgi:protoheme IX farnesyltransferase